MAEQSFWDMLRTKRDSLTKSGIIVADYLMQHAEDAQYLSISSLAKACGVAEATIFRFCRALGFDGYNEMKIALAKATATAMPVSLKLEPGVDTQTLCTHAYNTAIEALNGTRSALDPESVDRAATLLQRARQVFFFGQGGSYILACDIWARFSMLSTKFRTAGDSHMQAIAASLMGPEDVVVFVSYSGATRDMMDYAASGQGERCQGHPAHPLQRRPRRSAGRCRASVRCQRKPPRLRQHAGQAGRPLCGERPRPALHAGQSGACQPLPLPHKPRAGE